MKTLATLVAGVILGVGVAASGGDSHPELMMVPGKGSVLFQKARIICSTTSPAIGSTEPRVLCSRMDLSLGYIITVGWSRASVQKGLTPLFDTKYDR